MGPGTPAWMIGAQAFGFVQSLQFTSMNTLVYADVGEEDSSAASTLGSTVQQLSVSFGVAAASLATAVFVPDRFRTDAAQMVHGIHRALIALGVMTVISALVYLGLQADDGEGVSRHKHAGAEG